MGLNQKNIDRTITRIAESLPDQLTMGSVFGRTTGPICGTPACIAGFAYIATHPTLKRLDYVNLSNVMFVAECKLGLSHQQAGALFSMAGPVAHLFLGDQPPEQKAQRVSLREVLRALSNLPGTGRGYRTAVMDAESEDGFTLESFDTLPARTRQLAAIRVLEHLRDTGVVDWPAAIHKAGLQYERECECPA